MLFCVDGINHTQYIESHSARSAWIEIFTTGSSSAASGRTPHGVRGLKLPELVGSEKQVASHSARSAWIEIKMGQGGDNVPYVALRTECVD